MHQAKNELKKEKSSVLYAAIYGMLSPFLFALYISELVDMMKNEGCQGVYVDEQNPNILMFMYADDIASGPDTVS